MSIITGYPIPGSHRGQAFTVPDFCHGLVGEHEVREIAERLRRETGREPAWQTVRGSLIRLAHQRQGGKS